jgi:hypothetical protein
MAMANALEITAGLPHLPPGYLREDVEARLLPWEYVERRLAEALNFWVATTRPDGRPHVSPIWGVWHDTRFWFDGSPETRRGRNLVRNPNVAVNLEDGTHVVILEGVIDDLKTPELDLRRELSRIYKAKYAELGYSPEPEMWETGIYRMTPHTALAWTEFGVDMTRWKLPPRAD